MAITETWKERLTGLSLSRKLYRNERTQIQTCLSNPLAKEETYKLYCETFEEKLKHRDAAGLSLDLKRETIVCKRCSQSYEANVVYIFGHRQSRDVCPICTANEEHTLTLQNEARHKLQIAATRREWRLNCGIPPKYQTETFATFKPKRVGVGDAYKAAVNYAEQFPLVKAKDYPSLLLYSNNVWGNGKTHLVCAIAHRLLDRWDGEEMACPVMFISEPEIYARIQETYSFTSQEKAQRFSEQQLINKMVGVRLLIIDDLGKQERRDMDFVRRTLFDIINRRYNAKRPVVVTSNKNSVALKTYLGTDEAVFDRLFEMTKGHRIHVTGTSYRRQGQDKQ